MNSNGAGGREIESISSLFPHTTVQGEVYFCFGFWARCGRGDRVAPRTEQNGNKFRMKKSSRLVRSLGPSVFSFQARPPPPVTLVWRASNGPEETEQKMEIFRIMWAKKRWEAHVKAPPGPWASSSGRHRFPIYMRVFPPLRHEISLVTDRKKKRI